MGWEYDRPVFTASYFKNVEICSVQAWNFSGFYMISGILPVAKYPKSDKILTLINKIREYS